MWILRKLLAYLHIRRIASLEYSDGKVRDGEIVDESWHQFRVRAAFCPGIYRPGWIPKTEPTIRGIRWSDDAQLAGGIAAFATICLLITVFSSVVDFSGNKDIVANDIDPTTGLPVVNTVFYPDQLPDGHYSVAKVSPHGATVVIQHKPGSDRNFVHYVANRFVANVPNDCAVGDSFTIFRGQVV